jgi:hypothetical protein
MKTTKMPTGTVQFPAANTIYQNLRKKYEQVKTWISQTISATLEGQIMVVDDMIREGSLIYPYNFTGSPQSLFLLPNSYKRRKQDVNTLLTASAVRVERLDEHWYEVKFTRKIQEAILNIYDVSGELLFTEQINQTGTFNLVYNLQWTGLSQVSFEVFTHNRFYQSGIL